MPTYSQLIEEVLLALSGFSQEQDQVTLLVGAIDSSVTTFTVTDAGMVAHGLAEIDDELMLVLTTDTSSNAVVAKRGWRGTTAASHSNLAVVIGNPRFPRAAVQRAINDTIRATYPALFVVKKAAPITFVPAQRTYELPADLEDILNVSWQVPGPTKTWPQITGYRLLRDANATAFPNGNAIYIGEQMVPGQPIHVVYRAKPTVLSNPSDDFVTVTGLEEQVKDVIVYGACYRLVSYIESGRVTSDAIEGGTIDEQRSPGIARAAGQYYYALYTQRLKEEQDRLLATHYGQTTVLTEEY